MTRHDYTSYGTVYDCAEIKEAQRDRFVTQAEKDRIIERLHKRLQAAMVREMGLGPVIDGEYEIVDPPNPLAQRRGRKSGA